MPKRGESTRRGVGGAQILAAQELEEAAQGRELARQGAGFDVAVELAHQELADVPVLDGLHGLNPLLLAQVAGKLRQVLTVGLEGVAGEVALNFEVDEEGVQGVIDEHGPSGVGQMGGGRGLAMVIARAAWPCDESIADRVRGRTTAGG